MAKSKNEVVELACAFRAKAEADEELAQRGRAALGALQAAVTEAWQVFGPELAAAFLKRHASALLKPSNVGAPPGPRDAEFDAALARIVREIQEEAERRGERATDKSISEWLRDTVMPEITPDSMARRLRRIAEAEEAKQAAIARELSGVEHVCAAAEPVNALLALARAKADEN